MIKLTWRGLYETTAWNNLPLETKIQYNTIEGQQLTGGGCP